MNRPWRLLPLLLALPLVGAAKAAPVRSAPSPEQATKAVTDAVCQWPLVGTVRFSVRSSALTDAIADAEAAGATDPNALQGAAILKSLVIDAEVDLPSGAVRVEVRAAEPITDPTRAQGLTTVRNGTHEVLGGMMMTLSGHRQPYFGDSPVTATALTAQGHWSLALQGVDGELVVDPATRLPTLARLRAGATNLEQTMAPWEQDGGCAWLGGITLAEVGQPAAVSLTFTWAPLAGSRFPSGISMATPAGQQIVTFEALTFVPKSP